MVKHSRNRCHGTPTPGLARRKHALHLIHSVLFELLLSFCFGGRPGNAQENPFITAATPTRLQQAIRGGVKHIVVTDHLDMTNIVTEDDMDIEVEALNTAVGRVLETTTSIAGRCTGPPPASFNLTEPVPEGACAILVTEDFLELPLGTLQFWLDSLYVAIASPGTSESSVLMLQVDGRMWVTNCVFQGAGNNSRAFDVTTKDGGSPTAYLQGVAIAGFTRILSPGIVVWHDAALTLDAVAFRNIRLIPRKPGDAGQVINSTAITAYPGAGILMQDVAIEGTTIRGEPAGARAVAVGGGAYAFAAPQFMVSEWPSGREFLTDRLTNSSAFPGRFLDGGFTLSGIQQEQRALVQEALGTLPAQAPPAAAPALPAEAPAPPPAAAPSPRPAATAPSPSPSTPSMPSMLLADMVPAGPGATPAQAGPAVGAGPPGAADGATADPTGGGMAMIPAADEGAGDAGGGPGAMGTSAEEAGMGPGDAARDLSAENVDSSGPGEGSSGGVGAFVSRAARCAAAAVIVAFWL